MLASVCIIARNMKFAFASYHVQNNANCIKGLVIRNKYKEKIAGEFFLEMGVH